VPKDEDNERGEHGEKRLLEDVDEDEEIVKRRKILEEARKLDAESESDQDSDER